MFSRIHKAAIRLGLFHRNSILVRQSDACGANAWIPRPKVFSSTTELAMRIISSSPLSVLWGFSALRDYICAWALWRQSPNAKIEGIHRTWPEKVFLSCHHRRTLYEADLCAQFLVSYFYKTFQVITDIKKPFSAVLGPLSTYFYKDTSINELGSQERHWSIAKLMINAESSSAISTFPDRCGSQFFGDTGMVFRPGLFAASLFTGVPIVDITMVEPTESCDCIHIVFTQWDPPKTSRSLKDSTQVTTASEYAIWRDENKALIQSFTLECEADYKSRLARIEHSKESCGLSEQVCENIVQVDDRVQKAMERNKNASMYVFK